MNTNSKISMLIDQATSNELNRPDPSLNLQVITEINSKADAYANNFYILFHLFPYLYSFIPIELRMQPNALKRDF
jgi:hypothetical protein